MARVDWGDAPESSAFYGRLEELETLKSWSVTDRCQLVLIRGLKGVGKSTLAASLSRRGIGKTDLSVRFANESASSFDYVIWRSLLNAPSPIKLLSEINCFISGGDEASFLGNLRAQMELLLRGFQEKRCLVVLDNLESILDASSNFFQEQHKTYLEIFKDVATRAHASCVLVNSREIPADLEALCGINKKTRLLSLAGLDKGAGKQILFDQGCSGNDSVLARVVELYSGHPLALEMAARYIDSVYAGNCQAFLNAGERIFQDLRELLDWHFERLTARERELFLLLSVNREPMTLDEIKGVVVSVDSKRDIGKIIQSIQRKIPLERVGIRFTLQPVLLEYAIDRLVSQVSEDIRHSNLSLVDQQPLFKATAKDYVRDIQARLILKPLLENLIQTNDAHSIDNLIIDSIGKIRNEDLRGYAAGNLINLLSIGGIACAGRDFSNLHIRQGYFQDINLQNTSFDGSLITDSIFSTTLGAVLSLAIDPKRKRLFTGDINGEVHIWDVQSGAEIHQFSAHKSWVRCIALPDNLTIFATASSDNTVKIWDANSFECLKTIGEHTDQVYSVSFDKSGTLAASGSEDGQVFIFNTLTGEIVQRIPALSGRVRSVCFAPDRAQLAIGDRAIRIWDLAEHRANDPIHLPGKYVRKVTYSPDGKCIAVLTENGPISICDSKSCEIVAILECGPNQRTIDFAADGRNVAVAGDDGDIQIWNWAARKKTGLLTRHSGGIKSIAFRPNENMLASGSDDQTVKLWDVKERQCLRTIKGYTNAIRAVAFRPHSSEFASGSEDGRIRVWRLQNGDFEISATWLAHAGMIEKIAYSPDGAHLASCGNDGMVRIWNANGGNCLHVLKGHSSWVWCVAFSPTGDVMASASRDYTTMLWNRLTGQRLATFSQHADEVHAVIFLNDRTLATGSDDSTIKIWDPATGDVSCTLDGHDNCVRALAYSPQTNLLASGSDDQTIKIWDVSSGVNKTTFRGHLGRVRSLNFSDDGTVLCSSSDDGTVRHWATTQPHQVLEHREHESSVWSACFNQATKEIISGSEDGTICVWAPGTASSKLYRPPRLYEQLNVRGVRGLTDAQLASLKRLGAAERRNYTRTTTEIQSDAANPADSTFTALIMKGGGVKSLAYIGALKELKKYYDFNWYIGTSSGGILAVLLAAGYTVDEVESLMYEKDFSEFLDAKPWQMPFNLIAHHGLHPAHSLVEWIDELLAARLHSHRQVKLNKLQHRATIYACRRDADAVVFDSYDLKTGDTAASHAVRCSMTIPILFTPRTDQGMRMLDGGIRNNFPIEILLRDHPQTNFIGLYLGPETFDPKSHRHGLISDLLSIWTEATDADVIEKYRDQILIIDPRPISTTQFRLTKYEKEFLVKVGRLAALRFLRKQKLI